MKSQITLKVNGKQHTVEADLKTPLLYVLRNNLALNGPKFGCGLSQCGACMVLLNGQASTSCMIPVENTVNMEITTIEGLADGKGKLHPVQEAFFEEQAAQCGYCLNGMVMNSVSLLNKNPRPTDQQIKESLPTNICRCGVHSRVVKAVKRAANG